MVMDVFLKSSPICQGNQDPRLALNNSHLKFFFNTIFIIVVTILSWVHWLYSMKQRQWESSPQSVMVKHWITIGSFLKVIILGSRRGILNIEYWISYLKILGILNIYLKNVRKTEYFNRTHAKARIGKLSQLNKFVKRN